MREQFLACHRRIRTVAFSRSNAAGACLAPRAVVVRFAGPSADLSDGSRELEGGGGNPSARNAMGGRVQRAISLVHFGRRSRRRSLPAAIRGWKRFWRRSDSLPGFHRLLLKLRRRLSLPQPMV